MLNMKKIFISLICLLLILCMTGCIPLNFEQKVLYTLPKCDDKVTNYSEGFRFYTDYCKYFYTDESIIDKIENNDDFCIIDDDNIEIVKYFFEHYSSWAIKRHGDKYDFSMDSINEGDYFNIYIPEQYLETSKYTESYDMFFFDKESLTLYYIHNNI